MSRRLEITLGEVLWERLNEVRGHEPRASFVKRALEKALDGVAASGFDSRGPVAGSVPGRPASPRASEQDEALHRTDAAMAASARRLEAPAVQGSSLAKVGVRPVPKRGEK